MSAQVLDGFMTDISDAIIAALKGPRGPEILRVAMRRAADSTVDLEEVMQFVCARLGETPGLLRSKSRIRGVCRVRDAYCALARRHTSASFPEIARGLERDHTTIITAARRGEAKFIADADLAAVAREAAERWNTGPSDGLAEHG